jgi:hypothetical protein
MKKDINCYVNEVMFILNNKNNYQLIEKIIHMFYINQLSSHKFGTNKFKINTDLLNGDRI